MMRVLHIAEDKNYIKLIKRIVKQNGFYYQCASSYSRMYDMLDNNEYDLLILNTPVYAADKEQLADKLLRNGFTYPAAVFIDPDEEQKLKTWCLDNAVIYLPQNTLNYKRLEKYLQIVKSRKANIELLKKMNIAIIDKDHDYTGLMKKFFLTFGIDNIDYYSDPSEFLRTSKSHDLILANIFSSICSNEAIIIHAREINPMSIVFLISSSINENIISYYLNFGINEFILKPVNLNLFMSLLNSCIAQYKLRKDAVKNRTLFEIAMKDSLTGIYNRAYFVNACRKKSLEVRRMEAQPFSLILFDIDYFKNINDEYGHLKGDYVLKEIARVLKNSLRKTDILCRWGGEEIIALLSDTNGKNAAVLAEKIRANIETHYFKGMRKVTASFGVTQWRRSDNGKSAFKRLDNSLYLAKLTGRNKVVSNEKLQITLNGTPIMIEWGPFFKSGHPQIDEDHNKLINMSNKIIFNCFNKKNTEDIAGLFDALTQEVIRHYKNEETILKKFKYGKYAEHKKTHDNLASKIVKIKELFYSDEENVPNAVRYMIQKILIGHVIKDDFDFFYIFKN